jgi:hypothetical protein
MLNFGSNAIQDPKDCYTKSVRIGLAELFGGDCMLFELLNMNPDQLHGLMDSLCSIFRYAWLAMAQQRLISLFARFLLERYKVAKDTKDDEESSL